MAADTFLRFPDLSPELRERVRAFAFAFKRPDFPAKYKYRGLAPLACVNKEWQTSVEKLLFRHLSLQIKRKPLRPQNEECRELSSLRTIVTGPRRRILAGISFDILFEPEGPELETIPMHSIVGGFSVQIQPRLDSLFTAEVNDIFQSHFHGLYRILESWKVDEVRAGLIGISVCFRKTYRYTSPGHSGLVQLRLPNSLSNLPMVSVVRSIQFRPHDLYRIYISPLTFLQMYQRTPNLSEICAEFDPFCCVGEPTYFPALRGTSTCHVSLTTYSVFVLSSRI